MRATCGGVGKLLSGIGCEFPSHLILERLTYATRGKCTRVSVTEQIIEVVERGSALSLSDAEIDEMLLAIGCSRLVHRTDALIAYYNDGDGQERFVIITREFR